MFPAEHLFIQTFWQTMNREWKGIDGLRLDKYYMVRSAGFIPVTAKAPEREGGNSQDLTNSGKV